MTSLERVREAVVKAVPEIMELKFGCDVLIEGIKWKYVGDWQGVITVFNEEEGDGCASRSHIERVIGRPITLADVLMAMKDIELEVGSLEFLLYGSFARVEYGADGTRKVVAYCLWDLSLPLDGQSPETIAFLHSILCQKQ